MLKIPIVFWIGLMMISCLPVQAQSTDKLKSKLERYRRDNWPPPRNYSRVSLGYVLQKKFKKHTEYCGFTISDGKRDYVPEDISRFLGKRDLRTKVESADIRGGGLLYYIFSDDQLRIPFDEIKYQTGNVLTLNSIQDQFVVDPNENFDSFVLTKNCSGYLKSYLDAGIEPPYVAFKTALETDSRRESSIVALSGSFVSPLKVILDANDSRTIEVMMRLWQFYADHPEYIGRAYYLAEFEGVMVKHVSSTEENAMIEAQLGINVNLPLAAHVKSNLTGGRGSDNSFLGTDWETIIYSDFKGNYSKRDLFEPLPTPNEISAYFANIKPTYQKAIDFPLMTEGVTHQHYLIIEGIPEGMSRNFWKIERVSDGVYNRNPYLETAYFPGDQQRKSGCRFTVSGRPLLDHFRGPLADRPSKLDVQYTLKSLYPVGGQYISFNVREEIQTSSHPIASLAEGEFDLTKKEDRRFAFQWKFDVEITDRDNPVNFAEMPFIDNLQVRSSDRTIPIRVVDIQADQRRKMFTVTLETLETFPLDRIDDHNMESFNLTMDFHLQGVRSAVRSIRPIKGILVFPSLRKIPPMSVTQLQKEGIIPEVESIKGVGAPLFDRNRN